MFADEVADLKDAYPARMQIVHVLSREPQEVELFSGRLDAGEADRAAARRPSTSPASTTGGCAARSAWSPTRSSVLRELGVGAGRIHRELFWVGDEPPAEATHADAPVGAGASRHRHPRRPHHHAHAAGRHAVLDGAQQPPRPAVRLQGRRLRHLPRQGHRGEAAMRRNYALEQRRGRRRLRADLPGAPVSDEITVDYDA